MHITPEYQKQQEKLHAVGNYGVTAGKYAPLVSQIVDQLQITHLLDYGCGSNVSLAEGLKDSPPEAKFTYQCYDPGVSKFADDPIPAEMVVCFDVLEHIEPEFLHDVLDHLAELTEVVAVLSIHMGPAGKTLDDGRNAHLTQQPLEWWLPKIWERFAIQTVQVTSPVEFHVICHNAGLTLETE